MTPRPSIWRRFLWQWSLLALFVVLVGGHTALWHVSMQSLERGFARWQAQRQGGEWQMRTGQPARSGYPFAASLDVPDVVLRHQSASGAGSLSWHAERVRLRLALWRPWLLDIATGGAQRLRVGERADIPFRSDSLRLLVPLEPGFPRWTELLAAELRAGMPTASGAAGLTVRRVDLRGDIRPAAPEGEAAITVTVQAEAIHLPDELPWVLGPNVAAVALEARLGGPLPRGGTLSEAASQWRDGGGAIEIVGLHLRWGTLDVTGSATLALDEQLQPMGSGTLHLTGQDAALEALTDAGVIKANTALMIKGMLSMFATPPATAAPGQTMAGDQAVELPLSLQDRRLMLRRLPLARLPVLTWPTP